MNDEFRQLIAEVRSLRDRVAQLEAANLSLSAADMLAAVKTVDGSGSGLDADTVDGVQASAVGQLGVAATWTQTQTFSGIGVGVAGALLSQYADGVTRQVLDGATLANDATLAISARARGLVYVDYAAVGLCALYSVDGGGVTLVAGSSTYFGTAVNTASKINVYVASSQVTIQNKTGSSTTILVYVIG